MQPVVTAKRLGWLAATTIILGVIIGAGAGLLTLLLYGVEHVMLGYVEGSELPGPFGVPAVRRAISVTIGLTLAGGRCRLGRRLQCPSCRHVLRRGDSAGGRDP